MSDKNLQILINAKDQATETIKKVQKDIKKLWPEAKKVSNQVKTATTSMSSSFNDLAKSIWLAAIAYAGFSTMKGIVRLANEVEQAAISFETLLWTEEAAIKMLANIDEFAAKTPFNKLWLTKATQQMLGFGFSWDEALASMQVLWDAISAVGRWQDDLNGVVLALGQIRSKGKLSTEEVMQMAERGLPVFEILEKQLWLTKKQLWNLWNQGIDSATAINALLVWLNEKFAGNMQKQTQTMAGMWSNLVDNIEIAWAKIWLSVQWSLKQILWSTLEFIDKNLNTIIDFGSDVFTFIVDITKTVFETTRSLFLWITEMFWILTNEQWKEVANSIKIWKKLFLFISMWLQTVMLFINTWVRTIFWFIKAVWTAIGGLVGHTWNFIKGLIKTMVNWIIWGINSIINWVNTVIKFLWWWTLLTPLEKFSTRSEKIALQQWKVWEKTKKAFDMEGIWKSNQKIFWNMLNTMNAYETDLKSTWKTTSNVFWDIQNTIWWMAWSLKNFKNQWKEVGKWWVKSFKAIWKEAEKAIKPITKVFNVSKKEIQKTQKAIKKLSEKFIDFKWQWVRAILEVNKQLLDLKKAWTNIEITFEKEKTQKLQDRFKNIKDELKDINKDLAELWWTTNLSSIKRLSKNLSETQLAWLKTAQFWNWITWEDILKYKELQAKKAELEKESKIIKENITEEQLKQIENNIKLSETEKILLQIEKEKARELEKNKQKIQVLLEKKKILELQANQKSINDLKITTEIKNWILKAFYEDEKWKQVEIKNYENVLEAEKIVNKQLSMQQETEMLLAKYETQKAEQIKHLNTLKDLWKQYNTNLTQETANTVQSMIAQYNTLETKLKRIINLRKKAGVSSSVDGAKATWWTVVWGRTYLVGERWPELFTAPNTWNIVPNNKLWWGRQTININITWNNIWNEADENRLVEKIKTALARDMQYWKFWIS